MRFYLESHSRPLYWWPLTLNIQLNAIQFSDFLELWILSDTSEHHDRPERNSNRVRRQRLRQAPGFLDIGPRPVVPSCRGGPSETPKSHSRKPNSTTSYRNFPRRLWSRYAAWSWVPRPPGKAVRGTDVVPLLYAESMSAWSNQGSVMCLLSILNQ